MIYFHSHRSYFFHNLIFRNFWRNTVQYMFYCGVWICIKCVKYNIVIFKIIQSIVVVIQFCCTNPFSSRCVFSEKLIFKILLNAVRFLCGDFGNNATMRGEFIYRLMCIIRIVEYCRCQRFTCFIPSNKGN